MVETLIILNLKLIKIFKCYMFVNELGRISVKTFCCCVVKSCFGSEGLYKANQELKKKNYIYIYIYLYSYYLEMTRKSLNWNKDSGWTENVVEKKLARNSVSSLYLYRF